MTNREVFHTQSGSNGAGWFIAGILVALIAGAGALYFGGVIGTQKADVNLSVDLPDMPKPAK